MDSLVVQTQTQRDTGRTTSAKIMTLPFRNQYTIDINVDMTDAQVKNLTAATLNSLKSDGLQDFEANVSLMKLLLDMHHAIDEDRDVILCDSLMEHGIFNLLKGKTTNYKSYSHSDKDIRKTYFRIVLSVIVMISNSSSEFSKLVWSDYDFKIAIEDVLTDDKSSNDMRDSCLAIIHNCIRRNEVIIKSFSSDKVIDYIKTMLESSHESRTKIMAAMILAIVVTNEQIHFLDGCQEEVKTIMQYIEGQWESNIRTHKGFHIDETLQGLNLLCRNKRMVAVVVSESNYINLLKDVASSNNRSKEVSLTISCFQRFAQLEVAKRKLKEYGIKEFLKELSKTCKFEELRTKIHSAMMDIE